jgi:putative oxidoreductase
MNIMLRTLIQRALGITGLVDRLQSCVLLALRVYVSYVFLNSGLVKISDWSATLALFHDEYKVPLLPPDLAAYVGAFGELAFPVLVVLGLMGRLGAAGLFMVNLMAVISYPQLWGFDCPAGLHMHFVWGGILLGLAIFGPGKLSLDALILKRMGLRPALAN